MELTVQHVNKVCVCGVGVFVFFLVFFFGGGGGGGRCGGQGGPGLQPAAHMNKGEEAVGWEGVGCSLQRT